MVQANVSQCANPECHRPFRKLGEGRLYVRHQAGSAACQKALWLCGECAIRFELRFDRKQQEFRLVRHRHVA